ncbi:hypothetical protein TNIN_300651 [Trichonephila inaurata madagascariensis]|uniref:C2H2-type domain-containing protein n=1 Tax=Trichonephila inaurata madagascariensis TaxID=2747483 RepID=A0A8X7BRC0_9ARAC|nr:hypothetical protein TNIN_300651 [Trichonephila inaurata madagascariensis]
MDDTAMFGYTSQNTSLRDSEPIEDHFLETQEFNTSRFHTFYQQQNRSHGEKSNSHSECSYSNEENWELQEKRDQKDSVKEKSNRNDELLFTKESHTIDTSRSKCDKEELFNKVQEQDSSVESFKSSHSQVENSYFERAFICDICLKTMSNLTSLLKHNCIHSNKKHFQHGVCQETVSEVGQFSQQKRTDTEERSFQCTMSEQVFPENDRERDIRLHTVEKSIQSDVCEGTFSNTSTVIRRKPTHSRKETHQCNLCGKTFSQKPNLNRHMREHTGKKPFTCVVCEQRFSQEENLNRHMRTHTGEKPFQCTLYERTFSQKHHLHGIYGHILERRLSSVLFVMKGFPSNSTLIGISVHTLNRNVFSGKLFGKVYPNQVFNLTKM